MDKKEAIILFGAPGSGKGTQGELLENKIKFKRYVMSSLIKKELKDKKKTWAKKYEISSGLLLGDEEIFEIFRDNFKLEKKVILDGIPRTLDQSYWLFGFLTQHNYIVRVMYYYIDEKILLERILIRAKEQKRKDDTPEVFKKRIKIFDDVKKVILEVYKKNIIKINGSLAVDLVFKESLEKLKKEGFL